MTVRDDEISLELLRRGRSLAASVAASSGDRYAWVGVYPLDSTRPGTAVLMRRLGVSSLATSTLPLYRIRRFEVARHLVDADRSIGEDDLLVAEDAIARGDEALREKLGLMGVSLADLEQPWKTNYPI